MPELPYNKIISLVPSLTELLIELDLKKQLIGRTRFCIHPENIVQDIEIIGGTKNPNIDKITELKPDLIIANKEENREEDILALQSHAEIMVTEISTVEDALVEINRIGRRTRRSESAQKITSQISAVLNERPKSKRLNTAYLIWKDPWKTVGNDTYIHDVMGKYGLINIFKDHTRYPNTDLQELSELSPELILLSSEPYPFKEKHIKEIKEHFPDSKIELVNGEWFSWYGSRMAPSFKALNEWRTSL
ncbi:MAG: helical backbone metal receptor [Gracilimonas sp.]|nr:helical backbone metal receptor [Gracilimonas sp.]